MNKKRLIYYSLLFMVVLLQDYENDNHIVNVYPPAIILGLFVKLLGVLTTSYIMPIRNLLALYALLLM